MPGVAWPTWRDTQVRAHGQAAQALQIAPFHRVGQLQGRAVARQVALLPDLDGEQIDLLPVQIIMSGPDSQWHGIRQLYFHLITSARKHVYIQSPFFIPDETIAGSYARRSAGRRRRAPDLHAPLATSTRFHTGGQHLFRRPGRGRVKTHLYDDGYYHAKTVNMDSQVCSIGSCNMDIRSYNVNYELNSVIYSRSKAEELAAQFMRDLEKSTPVRPGYVPG
ncbi:MAG: phospholipase D-like domain-containing protein [Caldilineaceae bacterium]